MAIVKTKTNCDLIISVKIGEDDNQKPIIDNHRFSKIKVDADDAKLLQVAKALSDVILRMELTGIEKAETFELAENQQPA